MTECVFDTNVLQKANAPINDKAKEGRKFQKRLKLLKDIKDEKLKILISQRLLTEYEGHIIEPRNEFIRFFLEQLTSGAIWNWHSPWTGLRTDAIKCGFPAHDHHVLRTAIRPHRTRIYSEENAILHSAACIKRVFNVEISDVD